MLKRQHCNNQSSKRKRNHQRFVNGQHTAPPPYLKK